MESNKTISIGDKSYFNTFIWKRVLRKDLEKIKDSQTAIIPLYSANVHKPFWFVESSNISDFSSPYILWWIDGDFDFSIQEIGSVFATTDHCGCIKILDQNIYPGYLLYVLRIAKTIYNFDRSLRSSLENISKIEIPIPIKENGEFDLEKQKEIARKYEKLEKVKDRIRIMKEDLENQNLSIEDAYTWEEKNIKALFDLKQWDAFYTKKRILENNWIWDIPIYSSNTKEEGLLTWIKKEFIKEKDLYYQNCLTWSIDWYAWKIFARNTENISNEKDEKYYFTINNHCWILLPKLDNLDLPFVKIMIQHKFFKKAKWYWNNKLWNNQIQDIFLKIPISKNWEFDLEKQKEIAKKYEKIEKMKKTLLEELEYLEKVKVEI